MKNSYLKAADHWIWPILRSPDDLKIEKKWKEKKNKDEHRSRLLHRTSSLYESHKTFSTHANRLNWICYRFEYLNKFQVQWHRLIVLSRRPSEIYFLRAVEDNQTVFLSYIYTYVWALWFDSFSVCWATITIFLPNSPQFLMYYFISLRK